MKKKSRKVYRGPAIAGRVVEVAGWRFMLVRRRARWDWRIEWIGDEPTKDGGK